MINVERMKSCNFSVLFISCVAAFESLSSCPDKMCPRKHASSFHRTTHDLPARLFGILARSLGWQLHGNNFLQHGRRFVDATGRLPYRLEVFQGNKVGAWLMLRRSEAKRGRLSGERKQLIEDALGVDVLKPLIDLDFERNLADVAGHRRLHGKLPTSKSVARHLGIWLSNRRQDANSGYLSKAYAQRLDTVLGAEWRPEFKSDTVRLPRHRSLW